VSGPSTKWTGGGGLGEPGGSPSATAGRARHVLASPLIALVYLYRWTLGVLVPSGTCKYHPSCSQYALDALRKHGPLKGAALAGWRLLRCNPWSPGGVDYP
jgi:putative membrane protein insertion efficiency factor